MKILRGSILSLAAVVLHASPARAAKAPAIERTESLVAALLKVKADDGKLTAAQKEANAKVFGQLDGYFDFDRLTTESIATVVAKFKPEEATEFKKKLRDVIRLIAYPDSGSFFKKTKYTLGSAKEQGETAVVPMDAKVPADDLETQIDFHWRKTPEGLRIVDVSFDGDSMIKDYQNQFARIIDKEGVKGLLDKLEKRRTELQAPPKSKPQAPRKPRFPAPRRPPLQAPPRPR